MCQRACVYDGTHVRDLCDDCMEDAYDLDVLCRKDPEREPGHKPASEDEWYRHYRDSTVSPAAYAEFGPALYPVDAAMERSL